MSIEAIANELKKIFDTGYTINDGWKKLASYVGHEICICAAVRLDDGRIIKGHRHADCIRNVAGRPEAENLLPVRRDQQGFVTSKNRYVDRAEAARLQNEAGILSVMTAQPIDEILTSEDLY